MWLVDGSPARGAASGDVAGRDVIGVPGEPTLFTVTRSGGKVSVSSSRATGWRYELA
ncbi:hypothetical protein [Nonomuraea helvata]|uniref:Uncharacterized protein n=1 Tax=Nonomuraea helvata TaxID=37484 RepID=A0ABV5S6T9_9ACTN